MNLDIAVQIRRHENIETKYIKTFTKYAIETLLENHYICCNKKIVK